MWEGWTWDLTLNLIAEFIGMGFTVLIIDRIIKNREEKRWLPNKNILYGRLLNITGSILRLVLPRKYFTFPGRIMYYYGDTPSLPVIQLSDELVQRLTEDFKATFIIDGVEAKDSNVVDFQSLERIQNELSILLNVSLSISEPELLQIVLDLHEALNSLLFVRQHVETTHVNLVLEGMLQRTLQLRLYLERRVSRKVDAEDLLGEIRNASRDLEDFKERERELIERMERGER
jgi:hypothetical protein